MHAHEAAKGRNSFKGTLHLHAQGMYMEKRGKVCILKQTRPDSIRNMGSAPLLIRRRGSGANK